MGGAASAAVARQGSSTPRADRDPRHVYSMQAAESASPKRTILLFLGPGGCGKSTLCLQMQATFANISEESRIQSSNDIVRSMRKTVAEVLENSLDDESVTDETIDLMEQFEEFNCSPSCPSCREAAFGAQIAVMYKLWHAPDLANAKRTHEKKIAVMYEEILNFESTDYFLSEDKFSEICSNGFLPSDEDIMKCRRRTDTAEDTSIQLSGRDVVLRDVGGQSYRRCEWVRAFKDVNVVVFIVPLDSYIHKEGPTGMKRNALLCTLDLARDIAASDELITFPMIIIFNKLDCFEDLIQTEPLTCIPSLTWKPPKSSGNWARSSRSERRGNTHSQYYCDCLTKWFVSRVAQNREEKLPYMDQHYASGGSKRIHRPVTPIVHKKDMMEEGKDITPPSPASQLTESDGNEFKGSRTPENKQPINSPLEKFAESACSSTACTPTNVPNALGGSPCTPKSPGSVGPDPRQGSVGPDPHQRRQGIVKCYTVCAFDRDLCSSIVGQIIDDFG